ncbi:MAG: methylenetetrahydrofolate--tRNA-(uracil(54)-C(5))-methyltransferase (FADH(2)-oxidizing) TrmFO [Abditibacteriota bacterium]|nr:methylenetetrahydrofolate--tRNA-(uracil(54)-C(5))-methyltransferase (FADH(2)-oxidizing) TrmFO [Abditibacteriota bacterium]
MAKVTVIGGGLAGCECAWSLASGGTECELWEMRPFRTTPAHTTDRLGELVCSTSLKAEGTGTAHGLLKREMAFLGSLVLEAAEKTRVPGGSSLCVDKEKFSGYITQKIAECDKIKVIRREADSIPPEGICVVATGPLTSPAMVRAIGERLGEEAMYFFDAVAPSVDISTVDMEKAFRQSRYGKGEADYINCPLTKEEYYAFTDALVAGEKAPLHLAEDEEAVYYEGCLPIEEMASRGRETLAFGMLKPVGIQDPRTGKRFYAVLQLRQENLEGTVWGLVGCQTQLRQKEQKRIFSMIPALRNASFVRYGQVHRNTYIKSPGLLDEYFRLKASPRCFFAGQLIGVEGYMESAMTGLLCGYNINRLLSGREPALFPAETLIGALQRYVSRGPGLTCTGKELPFAPMNSNFGILPDAGGRGKTGRREAKAKAAVEAMDRFGESLK